MAPRSRSSALVGATAAFVLVALMTDAAFETSDSPHATRSLAQKMWWKSRSRWAKRHQAFLQFWEVNKPEGILQPEHMKDARKAAMQQFKASEAKQAEERARQRAQERAARRSSVVNRVVAKGSTAGSVGGDILGVMHAEEQNPDPPPPAPPHAPDYISPPPPSPSPPPPSPSTPTSTVTCTNTDDGATDPYGDGCNEYDRYPSWCGNYDDADFHSKAMCCVCGGGSHPAEPSPSPSPVAEASAVTALDASPSPVAQARLVTALDASPSPVAQARLVTALDASPSPDAQATASATLATPLSKAACSGRSTFNVKYGGCRTYELGRVNHNFCAKDGAERACAECNSCVGSSLERAAASSRHDTRRAVERVAMHDSSDVLSMFTSNTKKG